MTQEATGQDVLLCVGRGPDGKTKVWYNDVYVGEASHVEVSKDLLGRRITCVVELRKPEPGSFDKASKPAPILLKDQAVALYIDVPVMISDCVGCEVTSHPMECPIWDQNGKTIGHARNIHKEGTQVLADLYVNPGVCLQNVERFRDIDLSKHRVGNLRQDYARANCGELFPAAVVCMPDPKKLAEAKAMIEKMGVSMGSAMVLPKPQSPALALMAEVQKLSPKPGDLIVLRHRPDSFQQDRENSLAFFASVMQQQTGCYTITIPDTYTLESLDDRFMNAAGWYRAAPDAREAVAKERERMLGKIDKLMAGRMETETFVACDIIRHAITHAGVSKEEAVAQVKHPHPTDPPPNVASWKPIEEHTQHLMSLLETSWAIIANVRDWKTMPEDWQQAANRFRTNYHELLDTMKLGKEKPKYGVSPLAGMFRAFFEGKRLAAEDMAKAVGIDPAHANSDKTVVMTRTSTPLQNGKNVRIENLGTSPMHIHAQPTPGSQDETAIVFEHRKESPCGKWTALQIEEIAGSPACDASVVGSWMVYRKGDDGVMHRCRSLPYLPHELFGLPEGTKFAVWSDEQGKVVVP